MKSIREHVSLSVTVLTLVALLFVAIPNIAAQRTSNSGSFNNFNPPPCDYSDTFYQDNGIDPSQLVGRFGTARRTGPPATGRQVNWVADSTCSVNDPNRRNFRILATTGGFPDDGSGSPTEFISILAFVVSQDAFESSYSRTVGAINGGLDGDQQNAGSVISIVNSQNPRSIAMQDIVSNFEAYPAPQQRLADGTFATNPCQADMASPLAPATPCFQLNTVNAAFTQNLRQDWRFATNRNAMDGSDNNCISTDPTVCPNGVSDSPFGYFCDDLLGMWINTYFWYTVDPATPGPVCGPILAALAQQNGLSLDGTPIILTADELNNDLEANGCGAEGKEAVDGSDGGAVWLVCPAIPDPRNGAIARDAFLDQVHLPNGAPQNPTLTQNFLSLQQNGVFPSGTVVRSASQTKVRRSSSGTK
ncbi:MAG TPA: hypothetical protein VFE61_17860 [Candidatus Sulfotelmatobacter sp.]|jgi:hypothetical protein|nr:hypothetical protein [Candidatus Sulfotelmatobacter sp.]